MKGYVTEHGYKGYIPSIGAYLLFETETEYINYFNDEEV